MNFLAHAMGAGGTETTGARGGFFGSFFVPMLFIFAIFYFVFIRPQQKQQKQHREMLLALKKGDRVITSGGLHGEISGIKDDLITMEIAPKVRVKVSRNSIAGKLQKEGN